MYRIIHTAIVIVYKRKATFCAFSNKNVAFNLGWEMGFEPTVFGTTIRRFNQLSYTHHINK